jgi:hypothetical protein
MNGYKRLLLDTRPTDGDDVVYNVIVVVFTDLSADRAQGLFDGVLQHLRYDLKLWIGSGDGSAAYLPG